jgi:hypothetical protein
MNARTTPWVYRRALLRGRNLVEGNIGPANGLSRGWPATGGLCVARRPARRRRGRRQKRGVLAQTGALPSASNRLDWAVHRATAGGYAPGNCRLGDRCAGPARFRRPPCRRRAKGAAAQAGRRCRTGLADAGRLVRPVVAGGFAEWAATRPTHGALRDGWDFARSLPLAGPAAVERAERDATLRYDGQWAPIPRRRLASALRLRWVRARTRI